MTYDDFDQAKAAADELGFKVAGTLLKGGQPAYFLIPEGTSDEDVRARAFEVREGRAMSSYETWALEVAERQALAPEFDYRSIVEQVTA